MGVDLGGIILWIVVGLVVILVEVLFGVFTLGVLVGLVVVLVFEVFGLYSGFILVEGLVYVGVYKDLFSSIGFLISLLSTSRLVLGLFFLIAVGFEGLLKLFSKDLEGLFG